MMTVGAGIDPDRLEIAPDGNLLRSSWMTDSEWALFLQASKSDPMLLARRRAARRKKWDQASRKYYAASIGYNGYGWKSWEKGTADELKEIMETGWSFLWLDVDIGTWGVPHSLVMTWERLLREARGGHGVDDMNHVLARELILRATAVVKDTLGTRGDWDGERIIAPVWIDNPKPDGTTKWLHTRVWCEVCGKFHLHGWKKTWVQGEMLGNRGSHCVWPVADPWSGSTSFDMRAAGRYPDDVPHDHRGYATGCRCQACRAGRKAERTIKRIGGQRV